MDIEMIANLITNLGFPIALVIAMGFFIWKLYQQSVAREDKLMKVNADAIATISKYAEKLDIIEDDVKVIKETVILNK